MKSIDEDIKQGQLKNIYLLYGDERYLLLQYRDKIIDALGLSDDTMNFSRFEGEKLSSAEIIDLAETLPFFADRRLILIENSSFFETTDDALCDYLGQMPETTCLLFCEKKADKRSRMYKAVTKYGRAVDFQRLDPNMLQKWVYGRLKREHKMMTGAAYELFLSRTGNDMALITMELEKLLAYTGERSEITEADVEMMTSVQLEDKVFEMIDAISSKDKQKALELYYDLLALKVAPVKTLSLIARHYKILVDIKSMLIARKRDTEMAAVVGVKPFFVKKYISQCQKVPLSELEDTLQEIADLDLSFKTGNLSDQLAVELFILKHA